MTIAVMMMIIIIIIIIIPVIGETGKISK